VGFGVEEHPESARTRVSEAIARVFIPKAYAQNRLVRDFSGGDTENDPGVSPRFAQEKNARE